MRKAVTGEEMVKNNSNMAKIGQQEVVTEEKKVITAKNWSKMG